MPLANVMNINFRVERLALNVKIAGQQGNRVKSLTVSVGQPGGEVIDRLVEDDKASLFVIGSRQNSCPKRQQELGQP